MPYIDATCIRGQNNPFTASIEINNNASNFSPLDLNNYAIRFQVLGSPTADAKVLIEKIITQNTDIEELGQIDDPNNGGFTFVISKADTNLLGLGKFPIKLDLLDATSLALIYSLTIGDENNEFNAIRVVQV